MYVFKKVDKDGSVSYLSEVSLKPANWRKSLSPTITLATSGLDDDEVIEYILDEILVFHEKESAHLFLGTMALLGLNVYEFGIVYVD